MRSELCVSATGRRVWPFLCTVWMGFAACNDPYGFDWSFAVPDTVLLYSLSRPEYVGRASVFDFVAGHAIPIEAEGLFGYWDLGYIEVEDGGMFILPGALLEGGSQAIMRAVPGVGFDELRHAPAAGYDSAMVAIDVGTVYALRTRSVDSGTGSACRYAVKLEPLELNTTYGTLLFRYIINPSCGSSALSP